MKTLRRRPQSGRCTFCGCTDRYGCDEGCFWVNPAHTVCSRCRDLIVELAALFWQRAQGKEAA
jgi:hypothetical protein